jgi:hypothetical protein
MSELKYQVKVCKILDSQNYYYYSVPNGFESDNVVNIMNLKRSGMKAGVADIVVLRPGGRAYFLELKVGNNKMQDEQVRFKMIVESMGFRHFLVSPKMSQQEFIDMIDEMG